MTNDQTRILIAEDSPTQAEKLKFMLEQHGYDTAVARDGKEGLQLVVEHNPSLIISDIEMPEMNGFEFCKQIKANKNTMDIPVILLTSLSGTEDVLEGLACGADRFITKPSSENYLITHIEKTLTKRKNNHFQHSQIGLEVEVAGKTEVISVDPARVITLMISTYEAAIIKNKELIDTKRELKSFNDNLEELVNERTSDLVRINAEKDKFFSIIAHDLRDPLSGFSELTGLLAADSSRFSQARLTEIMSSLNKSAKSLFELLENLLEWAKMKKGTTQFLPTEINLLNIVTKSIELANQRALKKGITILNEVHGEIKVYADEKMLESVLRNLLSNAVKFTEREGEIIVNAVTADNNMVEISVADTGLGITEELIRKLFRIEEKVGTPGTENEPSSGLGLLLCKEFVERNNGSIRVESEVNRGSVFYFTLPTSNFN